MQIWSKGSYFREHQTFVSPFLAHTTTSTDTQEVGDPHQYLPEPHNSPREGTVHIFSPWNCQSLKNFRMSRLQKSIWHPLTFLVWEGFSLFFLNIKYFQQSRGYNSEAPLEQCNGKLTSLWATLRSGNRRSGALKGKQRWPKSRGQWLKAYRVWVFFF